MIKKNTNTTRHNFLPAFLYFLYWDKKKITYCHNKVCFTLVVTTYIRQTLSIIMLSFIQRYHFKCTDIRDYFHIIILFLQQLFLCYSGDAKNITGCGCGNVSLKFQLALWGKLYLKIISLPTPTNIKKYTSF